MLHGEHVNPVPQPDFSSLGRAASFPLAASGCCGSRSSRAVCVEKQKDLISPEMLYVERAGKLLLPSLVAVARAIKSQS